MAKNNFFITFIILILSVFILNSNICSEPLYQFLYNLSNETDNVEMQKHYLSDSLKIKPDYSPALKKLNALNNFQAVNNNKIITTQNNDLININSELNQIETSVNNIKQKISKIKTSNQNSGVSNLDNKKENSNIKKIIIGSSVAAAGIAVWYYWDDITKLFK